MDIDGHVERNKFVYILVGLFLTLLWTANHLTALNPSLATKFYDFTTSKADMALAAFLGFITGNVIGKNSNGNGNGNGGAH